MEPESEHSSLKGQFCEASGNCVSGDDSGDRGPSHRRGGINAVKPQPAAAAFSVCLEMGSAFPNP